MEEGGGRPRLTKGQTILCEAFCDMQSTEWGRGRVERFSGRWSQSETLCPGVIGLILVTDKPTEIAMERTRQGNSCLLAIGDANGCSEHVVHVYSANLKNKNTRQNS